MQDGLRLNFQVFSTKSGLSGRFYRQTKFSQRFRRKSGSGSSPSQRFSLISHESYKNIFTAVPYIFEIVIFVLLFELALIVF